MTDKPDVEKWAEAAGRAMFNGGGPKAVSAAFLRAAAADGYTLVRVPDERSLKHTTGEAEWWKAIGWGEAVSNTLASAVEVGK